MLLQRLLFIHMHLFFFFFTLFIAFLVIVFSEISNALTLVEIRTVFLDFAFFLKLYTQSTLAFMWFKKSRLISIVTVHFKVMGI